MDVIIVTGDSGAGKSTALNYLEDRDIYCVDNLPIPLIETFIKLTREGGYHRVAIGVDVRSTQFLEDQIQELITLKKSIKELFILYLTASDQILYRRFNETRRRHPVPLPQLTDSIRLEKEQMAPIQGIADATIDSSDLKTAQFHARIDQILFNTPLKKQLSISICSFGYKRREFGRAHLLFDVRFLPNPYFIPELRLMTGMDQPVYDYVINKPETGQFLARVKPLLDYLIPKYEAEKRYYFNIAIGCTGGQHRSVAIAAYLYRYLVEQGYQVQLKHLEQEE